MPALSVILPTFNRTRFLRLAVASVFAQTYTDWEMVVADDGSDEETRSYLRSLTSPRVQSLWLAHSGNPSRVRNAAIAAAQGRYLAFLDSDDVWAAEKLQKQMIAMAAHPECRWSYTACDRIDEDGQPRPNERLRNLALRQGWIFEPLLRLEMSIAMPTLLAERTLVCEVGGFDEEQRFGEFHDLSLRLAMRSQVCPVHENLCSIRAHTEHYSADRLAAHLDWMRLYEKMSHIAPTRTLQSHCARMRSETSLKVAATQAANGRNGDALATLAQALPRSWRYPSWWSGALRSVARMAVPEQLIRRLRRTHG